MKPQIAVVKSHKDGCVGVRIQLRSNGWEPSIAMQASANITAEQARLLAESLVQAANEADAKAAKKSAAYERREEWRDREIKAGRLKIITWHGVN